MNEAAGKGGCQGWMQQAGKQGCESPHSVGLYEQCLELTALGTQSCIYFVAQTWHYRKLSGKVGKNHQRAINTECLSLGPSIRAAASLVWRFVFQRWGNREGIKVCPQMKKFESFTFFPGGWFKRQFLQGKSDSICWQGATGKGSGTKRCFVFHKNLYRGSVLKGREKSKKVIKTRKDMMN